MWEGWGFIQFSGEGGGGLYEGGWETGTKGWGSNLRGEGGPTFRQASRQRERARNWELQDCTTLITFQYPILDLRHNSLVRCPKDVRMYRHKEYSKIFPHVYINIILPKMSNAIRYNIIVKILCAQKLVSLPMVSNLLLWI